LRLSRKQTAISRITKKTSVKVNIVPSVQLAHAKEKPNVSRRCPRREINNPEIAKA